MDHSQAKALVGLVQAYFPRPELPDSTKDAWATSLEPFAFSDGVEGVRWVGSNRSYPVLAEIEDAISEAERVRILESRSALPEHPWTEQDERASEEGREAAFREWREAHPGPPEVRGDEASG